MNKLLALLFGVFMLAGCATVGPAGSSAGPAVPSPAALDEPALMQNLRAAVGADPDKALALADEGEHRFPGSPLAEERGALGIRALVNLQRIGDARSRAEVFLGRYPSGPFSADVASMTGVHPRN